MASYALFCASFVLNQNFCFSIYCKRSDVPSRSTHSASAIAFYVMELLHLRCAAFNIRLQVNTLAKRRSRNRHTNTHTMCAVRTHLWKTQTINNAMQLECNTLNSLYKRALSLSLSHRMLLHFSHAFISTRNSSSVSAAAG